MDVTTLVKAIRLLTSLVLLGQVVVQTAYADESKLGTAGPSTLVVKATDIGPEQTNTGNPSQLAVQASDETGSESPGLLSVIKSRPWSLSRGNRRTDLLSKIRTLAANKPQQPVAKQSSEPKAKLTVVSNNHRNKPLQAVRNSQENDGLFTVTRALALKPVENRSQTKSPQKRSRTSSSVRQSKLRPRGQLQTRRPRMATRQQRPDRDASKRPKAPREMINPQKTVVHQADVELQVQKEAELDPAADALIEAHEISLIAKSEAQFSQVLQLCVQGVREGAKGENRDFSQKLSAWALNRRGQLRAEADQNDLAMSDFRAALDYDPNHWRALHNRGVTKAQSSQFAEAFDDFSRVIQLNPKFAKAYANRATLYVQAGDLQSALDEYDQALENDEALIAAHVGRGRVCHLLGRLDESLAHYDSAVRFDTVNAQIVCSRADLLADMGRYSAAMADYARAIDLQSDFAHAYRNGAWLLATCPDVDLRDAENALAGAQRALEFAYGERHTALDTLAAAHANAGEFPEAIATVKQAIDIAPDEAQQAYKIRLQLYEQNQPFRTMPLDR